MTPSWSCVLIARNEEKTLPNLLNSLEEFKARGGDVVCVDTGSQDHTVQIAKDWGCKVTEVGERFLTAIPDELVEKINARFVIENEASILKKGDRIFDFGAARDFAASLASNNYVSFADCDEAFTVLNLDAIEEAIKRGAANFEYEFVFSHNAFGAPATRFHQSKFFDRTRLHWTGRIHEHLEGTGGIREFLPETIFKLEHWQNNETNRSGYLRGLAMDCYEFPENDRHSHYFAREMFWNGRPKSAIKEFERHIAMDRWQAEKAQSMIFMGDCYKTLGDEQKAVECWLKSFETEPGRRESLMRLAWHYFSKNNYQKTACYASAALEIPKSDYYANQDGHYTNESHELLYWAEWYLGNKEGSKAHHAKALAFQPLNPKYLHDTIFYYEYPDQNIDGWMTFEELTWLYETAKKVNSIVEIGSWKGRSTHALLSGCKGVVTAIDHFNGSKDECDYTNELGKTNDIYAEFQKNVGKFPNLVVKRMSGNEGAKTIPDKSVDMVFIDAGHTYLEVMNDIAYWKNKPTKILCGHDYLPGTWMGVVEAVNECFGKPDEIHGSIWVKYL